MDSKTAYTVYISAIVSHNLLVTSSSYITIFFQPVDTQVDWENYYTSLNARRLFKENVFNFTFLYQLLKIIIKIKMR